VARLDVGYAIIIGHKITKDYNWVFGFNLAIMQ